jgi:hypothetical protein
LQSSIDTKAADNAVVHLAGSETITGAKTFSSTISGNISGSAGTITGSITKSQVSDFPTLATVATTGSYNDLSNKPSLFSGSYTDLTNKPVLFSGSYTDLTNKPTLGTAASKDAGAANGVASLDASGKVPTAQLSLTGLLVIQTASFASNVQTGTATCPSSNPNVIGGGFSGVNGGGNGQWVSSSYPSAPNVWTVTTTANPGGTWIVYAVCSK